MFEMPNEGITVDEAVKQFKASKAPETQDSPTDELDAVNVSEDDTQEEAVDVEAVAETESEQSDDAEIVEDDTVDDGGDLFYDLDGEEVSATQIKEWKSGAMMQADYTRKTQAHAEEVKKFKVEQEAFAKKQQLLDDKIAEVEATFGIDEPTEEQLQEMRNYEPEKYIEYTEKKAKRDKLLKESKSSRASTNFQEEYTSFVNAQDGWMNDGQPTERFKSDVAVMTKYAEQQGYTHDDLQGFKSHHFKTLLDAARYHDSKSKADLTAKKVRKAPAITRPKGQQKSTLLTQIQEAEKTLKRTGKVDDAVKLARLKSQLKN